MSIRLNTSFNAVQSLSAIADQLQDRWTSFAAAHPDVAEAAIKASYDDTASQLLDPTGKVKAIHRQQAVQVAVLFLAEIFGVSYVADQLARHTRTTVVAANRTTFVAQSWFGPNYSKLSVITQYLQLAINACLELQGLSAETDEGLEAYAEGILNLITETGLPEDEQGDLIAVFMPEGRVTAPGTFSATGVEAEDAEDEIPGSGDEDEKEEEAGNGGDNGNGDNGGDLGDLDDQPSHIGDALTQADTSEGAEQPDSEDEGAGSNDDTDTAPAGGDAIDPVEEAEERRDEEEAADDAAQDSADAETERSDA